MDFLRFIPQPTNRKETRHWWLAVMAGGPGWIVILCQVKINVTNAYAGSIAWSNFFARLTRSHPGRVVWLFFNVAIALLVMELGVYQALEIAGSTGCHETSERR